MRSFVPSCVPGRGCFLAALLAVGIAAPIVAQVGAGRLVGEVVDQARAAVSGATVTATSTATTFTRIAVTGSEGEYSLPGLAPGVYDVRVELSGFKPLVRQGVRISTGETMRLDLALELGGVNEAITVTGDAPLLRSQSGRLGHVVDNRRIVELPLNGRSFISLATLVPGVAMPAAPAAPLPRINGGRPRTNDYLFDGISVLQPEPGQIAFFPNIDGIQEFRIESNSPPAEFGRFNGGVVNLTTKSGGNVLRGTLFEFMRHESLNARNFFASTNPVKPKYRRNQFGGVIGGPIRQGRTFFFADYQGQRQNIGRTVTAVVPTELQRQGIFTEPINGRVPAVYDPASPPGAPRLPFANNRIPQDRWDPVAQSLLDRYPFPTSAGTTNNYRRTADETADQDQFSLRIDHRFPGDRDQVFARLTRFQEEFLPVTRLPDGSGGAAAGALGPQDTGTWSFASGFTRTFSSNLLNDLRIGDTRRSVERTAVQLSAPPSSSLGLPGIPSTAQFPNTLPTFSIAGYEPIGSPASTASDFSTSVTQFADSLTWLKGRHSIKMGADLRWERLNIFQPASPTGFFTFNNLFTDLPGTTNTGTPFASFLLGQVAQFQIDLQEREIRNRAHWQEYFIQDDWRVSDRITINAGLRYTLNFPSTEKDDQVAVFNLDTQQLEYAGLDGNPRSARDGLHKHNFGPRLGVAALLTDKTVVRGGYGLIWIEMAGITTPFTTPVFPFLQTVSQRTLDNIVPAFVLANGPTVVPLGPTPDAGLGQGVFTVDRDLGSGYVQQWNTAVQHELTSNIAIEIAYTGSKMTFVGIPDANINQLTVDQLAQGSSLTARVPNPYYGQIPRSSSLGDPTIPRSQLMKPFPRFTNVAFYRNNVGTTIYHGVYTKLEQRFSGGLSYLVSYTRSKLVDDASSVFDASILTGPVATNTSPADAFNRALERDYSAGDIPHVFVASGVWELPWGRGRSKQPSGIIGALANDWTLTGVLTLQSGQPMAVTQATNAIAFAGFGIQRPDLVGDPQLQSDERDPTRWFNTSAFAAAQPFSLGTASRNPVRGPGFQNVDLAIMRRLPLGATRALELRAEVFNVTNTPAFQAPNGSFGSPAFGTITTAGDPRVFQLALKFMF